MKVSVTWCASTSVGAPAPTPGKSRLRFFASIVTTNGTHF
jgi:hypothetical protein